MIHNDLVGFDGGYGWVTDENAEIEYSEIWWFGCASTDGPSCSSPNCDQEAPMKDILLR